MHSCEDAEIDHQRLTKPPDYHYSFHCKETGYPLQAAIVSKRGWFPSFETPRRALRKKRTIRARTIRARPMRRHMRFASETNKVTQHLHRLSRVL